MNIEKVFTDDHQVKLTVTFDQSRLEESRQRAARKIAQKQRIPGFRPGKAPYQVIVRTVGDAALMQEAIDILLEEDYPKAIKEAGIKAYEPGSLEKISSTDPLTMEFTVPLEPEVTLGDYKTIRIPYELQPVTDEQVNEFIENLRDRSAALQPVDRPAQENDVVFLRLGADRKNVEEGQSLVLINDRSTTVTIKPEEGDHSNEWPFPGFSRRLVGAKPGEEATFEYTYGDESSLEYLRGATAVFRYKVEEVKERHLPELDDEFAKTMGEFETVDQMRTEVRAGLEDQARMDYNREYDNKIFDQLLPLSTIKYPPQLLERETDYFRHQLEHRLEDQGLDMATYLKSREMNEADLMAELKPSAESRLVRSLVLVKFAQEANVNIDENEVQAEAMKTLNEIHRVYSPKEAKKMVNQQFIQNMIGNISSDFLTRNSLRKLEQFARGEVELENVESNTNLSAEAITEQTETPKQSKGDEPLGEIDSTIVVEGQSEQVAVEPEARAKRSKKTIK